MTGPEHYREAERLIAIAENPYDFELTQAERHTIALGAQVHATLSLAAATALSHWTPDGTMPQPDRMDWWRAASGDPAERQRTKEAKAADAAEFADGGAS